MKLGMLGGYTKYILMSNRQIQRTHHCNDSRRRRRRLCEQTFRQIVPTTLTNMRLETVPPFLRHQRTKNLIFLRPLAK